MPSSWAAAGLYQPFQRLITTRASNNNGHGLGLSIVRAIATAHGAALTTHPRAEGGLHIQATFPSPDGPDLAREAIAAPVEEPRKDRRFRRPRARPGYRASA